MADKLCGAEVRVPQGARRDITTGCWAFGARALENQEENEKADCALSYSWRCCAILGLSAR